MKSFFCLAILFSFFQSQGQTNINIVPAPVEIKAGRGNFTLTSNTTIVLLGGNLEKPAAWLNEYLSKNYGFTLKITKQHRVKDEITLNYERIDYPMPGENTTNVNGAYTMNITDKVN